MDKCSHVHQHTRRGQWVLLRWPWDTMWLLGLNSIEEEQPGLLTWAISPAPGLLNFKVWYCIYEGRWEKEPEPWLVTLNKQQKPAVPYSKSVDDYWDEPHKTSNVRAPGGRTATCTSEYDNREALKYIGKDKRKDRGYQSHADMASESGLLFKRTLLASSQETNTSSKLMLLHLVPSKCS